MNEVMAYPNHVSKGKSTLQVSTFRFLNIAAFVCLLTILYFSLGREFSGFDDPSFQSHLANFKTVFISIILEAMPFILLGVFVSAILQVFVSDEWIRRFIPKRPLPGVIIASLLGILFPICECGMIPIVRRLIQKGMPVYIAVVFILAGPIINPVVYASTFMAFRSRPDMAYSRMGLAFIVAVAIGLILYRTVKQLPLRPSVAAPDHSHEHHHHHDHQHHKQNRILSIFTHASDEFFEMGKYLIIGCMIAAGIQTFVDRESLLALGQGGWGSHLFMMGFSYVLSLCSTSDAFVASSFANSFTYGSLLTFLVYGAMLDFKTTLMLLSVFKTKFVVRLILMITVIVLLGSLAFEYLVLS